jgi:hypothetical protein
VIATGDRNRSHSGAAGPVGTIEYTEPMSWTEIIIALAIGLFFGMVQPTLSWFGERARRKQPSEPVLNAGQHDTSESKTTEGVSDE